MKVQTFRGIDGLWYWRWLAGNCHSIAVGGEGFASKRNAIRAAEGAIKAILRKLARLARATQSSHRANVLDIVADEIKQFRIVTIQKRHR